MLRRRSVAALHEKEAETGRESEDRFQRVVEASPMGIHLYALDDEGRLVFEGGNPAADVLLGVDHRAYVGKTIEEAFPPLVATEVPARYRAAAEHGERWSTEQIEYEDDHVKGAFEVHAFQTAPRRMAALFLDISERKRMEARLRQSEKMEAIGQLAGGIAHDFNNQLTGIMGYAELLASSATDPALRDYAAKVLRLASRSAQLTNQLLTFARKGSYRFVAVDLHAILSEVVGLLQTTMGDRVHIACDLQAAPSTTRGDPTVLQSAFLNLGINACDAMPDGGNLFLETSVVDLKGEQADGLLLRQTSGRFVLVRVSDTGIGMDAQTRKHLFEPFFTTKAPGRGTGMGLAAVYGAVRLHQGAIGVDSAVGEGTSFRLYLPCVDTSAKPEPRRPAASAAKRALRILLVDDDPTVRDVSRQMLESLGHEVLSCESGTQAVAEYAARWREIDLAIVDLVMPGMDGRETFDALRKINPAILALLATGYGIHGEAHDVVRDGMCGLLEKPFGMEDLASKLASAMRSVRRRDP
jgi:PAS domain S-box-containing protein